MIEIILTVVILGLLVLLGFERAQDRQERAKLVNALLARDSNEMVNLELADKTKIETKPAKEKQDLVDLDDLSDEEFEEKVLNA